MTPLPERKVTIELIQQACRDGARLPKACEIAGIALRTYRRWLSGGEVHADKRPESERPVPFNKLSDEERDNIVDVCNQPVYASQPPSQIVPDLLDTGVYLASESTFYRILHERGLLHKRGRARQSRPAPKPTTHTAMAPNQAYCWAITYLPSTVRGQFFYLYLFEDLFSRKIVGWEVHDAESGQHAGDLLQRVVITERCTHLQLVLHSDNGAPMKSQTLRAKIEELGITPSYSRPRVSDDNPYVESLFRTLKYCPRWPSQGFATLEEARRWVARFVYWYNHKHRHSKLRFVTPHERHTGQERSILAVRQQVLESARKRNPNRWGGRSVRNCNPVGPVTLNPDRQAVAKQVA